MNIRDQSIAERVREILSYHHAKYLKLFAVQHHGVRWHNLTTLLVQLVGNRKLIKGVAFSCIKAESH
jgi:hypothetical protein